MIVWGIQWDSSGIFKAHTCYVEDLWSSCIYLGFFFTQGCQGDLFFSFCLHIRLIFTANFECPTKIYCSIHLKYTNIINHNEKKSQHSWIYCLLTCSITADNMNKHQNKQENWPFAADLCCEITTFCPLGLYLVPMSLHSCLPLLKNFLIHPLAWFFEWLWFSSKHFILVEWVLYRVRWNNKEVTNKITKTRLAILSTWELWPLNPDSTQ